MAKPGETEFPLPHLEDTPVRAQPQPPSALHASEGLDVETRSRSWVPLKFTERFGEAFLDIAWEAGQLSLRRSADEDSDSRLTA